VKAENSYKHLIFLFSFFILSFSLFPAPASAWIVPEFEPVWEEGKNLLPKHPRTGAVWTEPATGMELVYVPGGCYWMGQMEKEKSDLIKEVGQEKYDQLYTDEQPLHEVCVDGFWLDSKEVTVGSFRKFVQATGYQTDAEENRGDNKGCHALKDYKWGWQEGYFWDKPGFGQEESFPAACVSWNDTREYIKWLNGVSGKSYRLPTEAEWEYAAGGGTKTSRYWEDGVADQACGYANVADKGHGWTGFPCDDGYEFSSPVGSYKPNGYGLSDMLGNVWEWCGDWYASDYYGKSPRQNPQGPATGLSRVYRGGGWIGSSPGNVRAAYRYRNTPDYRGPNVGFRLLLPANREERENDLAAFEAKLKAGEDAMNSQRMTDAVRELEAAAELLPDRREPLFLLARIHASQKNVGETMNAIGRLGKTGAFDFKKAFGFYDFSWLLKNAEFNKYILENFGLNGWDEIHGVVQASDISGSYRADWHDSEEFKSSVDIPRMFGANVEIEQDGENVKITMVESDWYAPDLLFQGKRIGNKLAGISYTYTIGTGACKGGGPYKKRETSGTINETGTKVSLDYEGAIFVKGIFLNSCAKEFSKANIIWERGN
jgi:formylglycine-generating enzyme required for sulfatase activity